MDLVEDLNFTFVLAYVIHRLLVLLNNNIIIIIFLNAFFLSIIYIIYIYIYIYLKKFFS